MLGSIVAWCSLAFNILIVIGGWVVYARLTGNDLKHLTKTVDEIKISIKCIEEKLYENMERVGKIEGKCKARTGC